MNFIPSLTASSSIPSGQCLPYIKCAVKIFNDSIHKVFYIHILYINPVYAMAEI